MLRRCSSSGAAQVRQAGVVGGREGVSKDHGAWPPAARAGKRNKRTLSPPSHRPAPSCTIAAAMQRPCPQPAARPSARGMSRRGWHHGLHVLLCLGLLWLAAGRARPAQTVTHPRRPGGGVRQPELSLPTQPAPLVDLPDDWSASRPGSNGPVWYRLSFTAPGLRETGRAAGAVHRACLHQPGGLPERPADPQRRADERADHAATATTRSWSACRPALIGPGLNSLDLKVVGHALPRVASTPPRRRAVGAGDRAAVGAGRQACAAGGAERGRAAGGERDAAADGQLHVRARLDQPARKPPGLLRRAVGGLGHHRIAAVAARPALRQRGGRVPAVRDAAAADLGQRAVPAALCPVPPALDRHRAAAAGAW